MKWMRSTSTAVAALAAATMVLTACAGGGDDADMAAVDTTDVDTTDGDGDRAGVEPELSDADHPAGEREAVGEAEQAAEPDASAGDDTDGPGTSDIGGLAVPAATGREVIRRAEIELAIEDPSRAVEDVTTAVRRAGGFVANADLRRNDDGLLLGTLRLRVPTDELDATLGRLEEIADEVRSKQISTEDVTGEVADVESQLRNLRALETELLTLLGEARETGSTDQVLTVFERVRSVRGEIERLEGRRQTLADLVALATIDVRLVPVESAAVTTGVDEPWEPATIAREALAATGRALQTVATGVIWLALTALPLLALVATPVALLAWVVRRRRSEAPAAS